jgi:hypothetical protein
VRSCFAFKNLTSHLLMPVVLMPVVLAAVAVAVAVA